MKLRFDFLVLLTSLSLNLHAAPPPAQLLPGDTLAIVTVPDWDKAAAAFSGSDYGQFWRAAEMKAFKDKFVAQFQKEGLGPLERALGVKLADYADLLHGQVTFGFRLDTTESTEQPSPIWSVIVDTKDKGDQLKKSLEDLKKKWVDAGKKLKTDKIREVEFSTFYITGADFLKTMRSAFAPAANTDSTAGAGSTNTIPLLVGQSDSLLLLGNNAKELEKILVRQSGGQVPALADQAEFQANQAQFRDAVIFGWLNFRPINSLLNKAIAQMSAAASAANPMIPPGDKVYAALGLDGLKSVASSVNFSPEGMLVQVFLTQPESSRKGAFKIFAFESKAASPPPFVPADAVKFYRWRLDTAKAWNTIEGMVGEISPQLGSMLQMVLSQAGKDKDPNFDMKRSFIGNLGDDWIGYEKAPRTFTPEALNSAPSLLLIGSPNGEQLLQGLKALLGVAVPMTSIKEREFLGRKISSIPMPSMGAPEGDKGGEHLLNFSASGGYVAITSDTPMLEEYLRSSENKPKPLEDVSGLRESAEKVGGLNTGLFGYENDAATMRIILETLKKNPDALEKILSLTPVAKRMGSGDDKSSLSAWIDVSLLPPFDKIARFFYMTVYTGASTPEGLSFKFFTPTPPGIRQ